MIEISAVVPTYRRPRLLERCLASLADQTLAGENYEVLVVSDGPDREAAAEAAAAGKRWAGLALRRLSTPAKQGPAAARNLGWRSARANSIAFIDDDCRADRAWLESGLSALRGGAHAAWGRVVVPFRERPSDYEKNASLLQAAGFVTANCFLARNALEEVGGLDERFTAAWREDSDLYFRLLRCGMVVRHCPQAVVLHPIRPAAWGVSLHQQRNSMFDALIFKKHPGLFRSKIEPGPPWNYYAAVLSLAAAAGAAGSGQPDWALIAASLWVFVTVRFLRRRLRGTSRAPAHIAEMIVTSALIPPVAVYWRLRGACKYRVPFL